MAQISKMAQKSLFSGFLSSEKRAFRPKICFGNAFDPFQKNLPAQIFRRIRIFGHILA